MQLLTGHDLSLSFHTREIFSQASFGVEAGAHIGLVGANGCGKTSLFRVLAGTLQPDSGTVSLSREARLAYMEQFLQAEEEESLQSAVMRVFAPLQALERRLEEVNARLERTDHPSQALLEEQQRLQERYGDQGGYTYRARLRSTLLGVGFQEEDLLLPVSALSGGQRSRAALAKVLLTDANLLLLDEPTNHLDIQGVEWLEGFLSSYKGSFLLISHDRYFLDRVTTETWALHHQRLHCYKGNYSAHLAQRDTDEESLRRRYENQMREIKRIQGIIEQQRRFNQERNYVTIASKQKQLQRLQAELVVPETKERTLRFHFTVPPPGGNDVLELHQVQKSFDGRLVFHGVDLHLSKGERVFLLGPNGCGKSTLMKLIAGRLQPDGGMVRLGVNIHTAYYDQLHDHLTGSQTILSYFTNRYPRLTQTEIRTMLGSFLFSGDAVEKTLSTLSGGEKARLTLMELLLAPANLLLLDEPTNHLDIASMEAVEQALLEYPGTILAVSHDRYLINKLADRIYIMEADGLTESLGNYDEYLERKPAGTGTEAPARTQPVQPQTVKAPPEPVKSAGTKGGEEYRRRKEEQAAARREQKRLEKLEQDIARLETELDATTTQLNDPALAADYQRLMELAAAQQRLEAELLARMEEWDALT